MSPRTRSKKRKAPIIAPTTNIESRAPKRTTQKRRGRSQKPHFFTREQQPNPKASKTPAVVPEPPKRAVQQSTAKVPNRPACSSTPTLPEGRQPIRRAFKTSTAAATRSSKRVYQKPTVESADETDHVPRKQATRQGSDTPRHIPQTSNPTMQQSSLKGDIKVTMAQIYCDIDKAWLSGMTNDESSCVIQVIDCAARGLQEAITQHKKPSLARRLSCFGSKATPPQTTPLQLMLCRRYAAVYARYEMIMLSILAYSHSFRNACHSFGEPSWTRLLESIGENSVSLELFFKVRGLDWATPLRQLEKHYPSKVVALYIESKRTRELPAEIHGRLHSYIVPGGNEPLHLTNRQGMLLVDNLSSKYDPQTFQEDPSLHGPCDGPCYSCHHYGCGCDPSTCKNVTKPLVELVRCPGEKGVGVRSLQRIRRGDVLNEYVGELKHANSVQDTTYALELEYPPGDEDRMETDNPILIDAQVFGNWTRYINASCNPSLVFIPAIVGRRYRMMIVATRDIEVFEELTIGYGDNFWIDSDTKMCECNDPNCRYPDPETKEKTKMGPGAFSETMDADEGAAAFTVNVEGAPATNDDEDGYGDIF
ncbi:MAG: hypothetical protein Q9207_001598 [Kuettlingeria erythrocarpa]